MIMVARAYMGPSRALKDLIAELENLRIKSPESIYEGEADEVLEDAYILLSTLLGASRGFINRPYTGLTSRIKLLAQYAKALQVRMQRLGTPYISGVTYFNEKLDELIMEIRLIAGLHPYLSRGKFGLYEARS